MKEEIARYTRQAAQALAQADRERKLQALADALGILRALTADREEGETAGEHLARYLSSCRMPCGTCRRTRRPQRTTGSWWASTRTCS